MLAYIVHQEGWVMANSRLMTPLYSPLAMLASSRHEISSCHHHAWNSPVATFLFADAGGQYCNDRGSFSTGFIVDGRFEWNTLSRMHRRYAQAPHHDWWLLSIAIRMHGVYRLNICFLIILEIRWCGPAHHSLNDDIPLIGCCIKSSPCDYFQLMLKISFTASISWSG